jgi:hypothetical protein
MPASAVSEDLEDEVTRGHAVDALYTYLTYSKRA